LAPSAACLSNNDCTDGDHHHHELKTRVVTLGGYQEQNNLAGIYELELALVATDWLLGQLQ
jgi:hypothetical protein